MEALGENRPLVFRDLSRVWGDVRTGVIALGRGVEHAEGMHSSGIKLSLDQAVDAWRVQLAALINAPSFANVGLSSQSRGCGLVFF